ncbi:MAG: sulfatase-like hydrolase/transferase [Verrucomicrobia bacterium]|nr:sulfatase-like hydrolase/transferase [Verrucomicrobiota bacterium]MCH8528875.1 sulfatase-like hydrolase/transferase [Kiritimatiellia bacterium]
MTAKPNVLLIYADGMCFNDIAALGNDEVITPNLDRLVRRGTTMRNAHIMGSVSGAVCIPSRSMLLTGRLLFGDLFPTLRKIPGNCRTGRMTAPAATSGSDSFRFWKEGVRILAIMGRTMGRCSGWRERIHPVLMLYICFAFGNKGSRSYLTLSILHNQSEPNM